MISCIEYIYLKNFIYWDVKLDNFFMGLGKKGNLVYIIDFGLVKKYWDVCIYQYIFYCENKNFIGMVWYVFINMYFGIE